MAASHIVLNAGSGGPNLPTQTWTQDAVTTHGQQILICDSSGNIVASSTTTPAGTEQALITRNIPSGTQAVSGTVTASNTAGDVAAAATDSGNPVKAGAKFSASPPTFTDGQRTDLQADARGNLRTVLYGAGSATALGTTGSALSVLPGNPTTKQNVILSTAAAGVAPTASDAMLTLALSRNNAAAGAGATSNALSANKTYRITSLSVHAEASTTTGIRVTASLRFNSAGAVTTASALLGTFVATSPAAVAVTGNTEVWTFPDGLDIPAGATPGQIGVSIIGSTATGLCWVTIVGYEF